VQPGGSVPRLSSDSLNICALFDDAHDLHYVVGPTGRVTIFIDL
jgi:hypothetical protein